MCKFCKNYDFESIGYRFEFEKYPKIYLSGAVGSVPENEKFKFCPVCGEKLTDSPKSTC